MDQNTVMFFENRPEELKLYQAFEEKMEKAFPFLSIRVQKTQISFSNKYNFAFASLPHRRVKGRSATYLIITFGLPYPLKSSRVEQMSNPYPNRWTHHVIVDDLQQLDEELMGWINQAYHFALAK